MSGELDHLSLAIGALQAEVKNLGQAIRDNQESATEEHRKVHDIVDSLSESMRVLTHMVQEMKPLTDDYRETRAEKRGAKRIVTLLYVTGGGLVGAFAARIIDSLGTFFSVRPH